MKKIMGRPKKEPGDRLSEIVQVRLTKSERAECEMAATSRKMKLSEWVRACILPAAKRKKT